MLLFFCGMESAKEKDPTEASGVLAKSLDVFPTASSIYITEQLLDLSLLNVEESSSVLLGRCRSLLERRRTGLGLSAGCTLLMQA